MQTSRISLKSASGSLPTLPGKQHIGEPPRFQPPSYQHPYQALQAALALNAPVPKQGPKTLPECCQRHTELQDALSKVTRRTSYILEPTETLQGIAKDYLALIDEAKSIQTVSSLSEQFERQLQELIWKHLIPLYLKGYIPAKWFQDYKAYMDEDRVHERQESTQSYIRQELLERYVLKDLCQPIDHVDVFYFEEQVIHLVLDQYCCLSLFLKEDTEHVAASVSRIEENFQNLRENRTVQLSVEAIANVSLFLIQNGRTSSIEPFLEIYKTIYSSLQELTLEALQILCTGWRRFFKLDCTRLACMQDLYPKDDVKGQSLVGLYLESLERFHEACQRYNTALEKRKADCCYYENHKANVVQCLMVLLQTVQSWKPGTLSKLLGGDEKGEQSESLLSYTEKLKQTINKATRPVLLAFAQEYSLSAEKGNTQDAAAAQAISAFLIRT